MYFRCGDDFVGVGGFVEIYYFDYVDVVEGID